MRTLEVARDDLRDAAVVEEPDPQPADGEVVLAVESFAITANTITYGVFGDAMGYWRFFPASAAGRGRIPAWGHARVLTEGSDALPAGTRLFGYVPMSTHLVLRPQAGERGGVTDTTLHRTELPAPYNAYVPAGGDGEDAEGRMAALRPLYVTGFLLGDHLASSERAVLSSASSKTALSAAWCLREHGVAVTGLTSRRNLAATFATKAYEDVLPYDDAGQLAPGPSAFVDFAGDPEVRAAVHHRLGDDLTASIAVGATHWEDTAGFGGGQELPGPRPEFFFAPAHIGPGSMGRAAAAWPAFAAWSEAWLRLEHPRGDDDVVAAFRAVLDGDVAPDVAVVASL
jgi:hypothetical protein